MKPLTVAIILSIASACAGQTYGVHPRASLHQQQGFTYQPQPTPQLAYTTPQTFQQPQQVYVEHQPQSQQGFKPQSYVNQQQGSHRPLGSTYQPPTKQTLGNDIENSARIINYELESDGHNYMYRYETENGIRVQEAGTVVGKGKAAQGGYSYTGDDGQVYAVTYTADENGFRPQGAHLPTPPPMSEVIAKAVEQNLQDEANGVVDDGSYTEAQHQSGQNQNYQQQEQKQPQPRYRQQTQQTPQIQYMYEQPPPAVPYVKQQQKFHYESLPQQVQFQKLQQSQQSLPQKQQYQQSVPQKQQYQQSVPQGQQYQQSVLQGQQYQQSVPQGQQYQIVMQYEDKANQPLSQVNPAIEHQIMRIVAPPQFQPVYQVGPTHEYP